jgi:general secretion pathway protein G
MTLLEKVDLLLTRPLGRVGRECGDQSLSRWKKLTRSCCGMTLLELMVAAMGMATLVAIALPVIEGAREDIRLHLAVTSIQVIQFEVTKYELRYGIVPVDIAAMNLPADVAKDPWGRPYVFLNYIYKDPPDDVPREDQFLKPINTAYDIFSVGPDGETHKRLPHQLSQDDIVRASDGEYIGVAAEF